MLATKRKPATVAAILVEEFMAPMGLTQAALAEAMGVQRKHVNELCNDRRSVTAPNRAHPRPRVRQQCRFLAQLQRRGDLWAAVHDPRERERIERAKPLKTAA